MRRRGQSIRRGEFGFECCRGLDLEVARMIGAIVDQDERVFSFVRVMAIFGLEGWLC